MSGSPIGVQDLAGIQRAQLEGGWVSLISIDQLPSLIQNLNATAQRARTESSGLAEQSTATLAQSGVMLAYRWQAWPAQPFYDPIRRMVSLQVREHDLNGEVADLQATHYKGLGGVRQRMHDRKEVAALEQQVAPVTNELQELSLQLARAAPPTHVPEVGQLRSQAASLVQRSQECAQRAHQDAAAASTLSE